MKKALMIISLILMGCSHQNIADNKSFVETCYMETNICKNNYSVLAEEIKKFNAAGGAFILVNLKNNEVLNSASISIWENFDYNQDYSYTPNNVKKLLKKERLAISTAVYPRLCNFHQICYKRGFKEIKK